MIFDVLKAKVHVDRWEDHASNVALSFEVVPQDNQHLDVGDKYVLSATWHYGLYGKDRLPLTATLLVSTDPRRLEKVKSDTAICGRADFFRERVSKFDGEVTPASLNMTVIVEPEVFDKMLRVAVAGAASVNVSIEGLDYGWEPDGSHQIWKLDESADVRSISTKAISSFGFNVETFWTNEQSIREAKDKRFDAELADSPDPDDRKLLASRQTADRADPIPTLLRHCRALLFGILAVGLLLLFKVGRL